MTADRPVADRPEDNHDDAGTGGRLPSPTVSLRAGSESDLGLSGEGPSPSQRHRPVADREPLSAEKQLWETGLAYHTFNGRCTTDWPSCRNTICVATRATLDAARPADESRLRAALQKIAEWQTHGPLRERDADAMVGLARAALAQPAVPVAGAEDGLRDEAIDALSTAIGIAVMLRTETVTIQAPAARNALAALRAAHPEDDGLDARALQDIESAASTVHDYIWPDDTDAATPSQRTASDAVWRIHNLVRPALAARLADSTEPPP
jgi:hypothetical protein